MASRRNAYDIPVANGMNSGLAHESRPAFKSRLLDRMHDFAGTVDQYLVRIGAPFTPYLPLIGRILVVSTFIEDSMRIFTLWKTQVGYMTKMRHFPRFLAVTFLFLNIVFMVVGSLAVVTKKKLLFGVSSLIGVLLVQALAYGHWDVQFITRMISLTGGLLLIVSEVFTQEKRRMPGLPEIGPRDRAQKVILVGRSLIVMLFLSHLLRTKLTFGSLLLNTVSSISCVLLVVGYKTRFSASVLAMILLGQNFTSQMYWRLHRYHPQRDFLRYEYFQVLSILGGLIMLVKLGAGALSFDEKRKIY